MAQSPDVLNERPPAQPDHMPCPATGLAKIHRAQSRLHDVPGVLRRPALPGSCTGRSWDRIVGGRYRGRYRW